MIDQCMYDFRQMILCDRDVVECYAALQAEGVGSTLQQARRKRASLAVVPRFIVLPQETNGKPLGPSRRVLFLRRECWAGCKPANIRQVLLKLVLGPTFHLSPDQNTTIISSLLYRPD